MSFDLNGLLGAAEVFKNIGFALIAVLGIMVMITVHEFGHYVVGKLFKFKINEFAIGMGPAIFKRTKKDGEVFSIRILPLGGFCSFAGEDEDDASPDSFNSKAPWKRILVLLAGATMNYILALVIIIVSMNAYGQSVLGVAVARDYVGEEQTYAEMSLASGDSILAVKKGSKKTNIYLATDLVSSLNHAKKGEEIYVDIIRDGEYLTVPVKLRQSVECENLTEVGKVYDALGIGSAMKVEAKEDSLFESGDYILKFGNDQDYYNCAFIFDKEEFFNLVKEKSAGEEIGFWVSRGDGRVYISTVLKDEWEESKSNADSALEYFGVTSYEYSHYTKNEYEKVGFFRSLPRSVGYSVKIGGTILKTLGELLTGRLGIRSVGGTVTTIVTATKVISYGLSYALEIFAFIGVNLAVFNLLPIPALDGSRIVFCIIEWIRKKPLNRKVEGLIHFIGFIFILGFAVLVDLLQFI